MLRDYFGQGLFGKGRQDPAAPPRHIMIASEGRSFSDEVIAMAVNMLPEKDGSIFVVTVARLWGTSWGLPNPGLRPSRREMQAQHDNLNSALDRLEKMGINAKGHIVTTRHPTKSIGKLVRLKGCDTVVMGADPRRSSFTASMMWSQEPYRVQKALPVPVHLACSEKDPDARAATGKKSRQSGRPVSTRAKTRP